ncbi:zinc ribbon domain-containing protein [Oceanobacillus halotolerans]|uniref:zinc ribbon domain-containing protein n=1 Tax=Oceanobacillus halotolerans TaxID=2663380 RepID=UPI0013DA60DB|nr:zinc-ribbon domain-containing protein [Oceanobacillus halotolerans]
MKFCKHCGKELVEGAKFCKYCGNEVASDDTPVQETTNDTGLSGQEESGLSNAGEDKPVNDDQQQDQGGGLTGSSGGSTSSSGGGSAVSKLTKQQKLYMAIAGGIIVLLIIAYQVGSSMTSHEKIVEKFETAMIENDADQVAKLLETNTKNLEIDENSVTGFIEYYAESPSDFEQMIQHLKDQSRLYENNPDAIEPQLEGGAVSGTPVNLVRDGKTFGIFDNYDIVIEPVYFRIYTNYEDTTISINGEEVATADKEDYSKEIGPYVPGTYTFTATYESDYVELSTETERTNFDPGYTSEVDLYIEGDDVEFYVPFENLDHVTLYLNGEDTGINLKEQSIVGPLLTDGSMTASFEAEFPWGTAKTEERPIESYYMDVIFTPSEEVVQQVQDTIVQFTKENLAVRTTADASQMTTATEDIVEERVDNAEYEQEYDYYYQGRFTGTDFYPDSYSISYYGDGWHIEANATVMYESATYYDLDSDVDLDETSEDVGYGLLYDEDSGEWIIDSVGWAGYYEESNAVEYREPEPETYTSEWAK